MVNYLSDFIGDGSDEVQRALYILTEVALAAGKEQEALEASDRALAALKKSTELTSLRTVVLTAQKRAWLALDLNKPHLGKDALECALAYLAGEQEKAPDSTHKKRRKEFLQEILFQRAQLMESRAQLHMAENTLELAEKDLHDSIALYEEAWGKGDETADEARALLKEVKTRQRRR